jgi:ammonia channel protein AmtB
MLTVSDGSIQSRHNTKAKEAPMILTILIVLFSLYLVITAFMAAIVTVPADIILSVVAPRLKASPKRIFLFLWRLIAFSPVLIPLETLREKWEV